MLSGVPLNSDRVPTYTATGFTTLCAGLHIRQSMGRVGSCFDNAATESFFSTLEWEVLSRHHLRTKDQARQVISAWINEFYNPTRRHSTAGMKSPIEFEKTPNIKAIAASPNPPRFEGKLRASASDPKWPGKAGAYFNVLNAASLKGSSLLTWGRLWLRETPRSTSSCATGLEVMEVPRSACRLSGAPCTCAAEAMRALAMSASSRAATVHPTT